MCYEQCHKLNTYLKSHKYVEHILWITLNLNTLWCADISKLSSSCREAAWYGHSSLLVQCTLGWLLCSNFLVASTVCVCVSATSWRCQATKRVDIKPKVIFQATTAWCLSSYRILAHRCLYSTSVKLTCLKTPQKNTSFWLSVSILDGWEKTLQIKTSYTCANT